MVEGLPLQHLTKGEVPAWERILHIREIEDLRWTAAAPDGALVPAETRPDAIDPGDSSGEATPVPIPNTAVKLSSAEDTPGVAPRENRSSPGSFLIPHAVR